MLAHFFQCPYCWEEISFLLDTSIDVINYIEDCEVCCNPISINVQLKEGKLISFDSKSIEQ